MLEIQIPVPCHEDWSAMTSEAQGRFCAACQKTVIDFSAMTDAQLFAFFEEKAQKTAENALCGHFQTQQLQRNIAPQPSALHHNVYGLWRNNVRTIAQASLLAAAFYFSSCEQPVVQKNVSSTIENDTIAPDNRIMGKMLIPSPVKPLWILPDYERESFAYPPPPPPLPPPPPRMTTGFTVPKIVATDEVKACETPTVEHLDTLKASEIPTKKGNFIKRSK